MKRRDDAFQYMFCAHCEKRGYYSRKSARAALRSLYASESGMNAYPCPQGTGLWHVGHLPDADHWDGSLVRRGVISKAAVFENRRAR